MQKQFSYSQHMTKNSEDYEQLIQQLIDLEIRETGRLTQANKTLSRRKKNISK